METKLCRKCGRVLELSAFGSDKHQFDGLTCYCRECVNKRQRSYLAWKKKALRYGLNPKLGKFTLSELAKEIEARLNIENYGK